MTNRAIKNKPADEFLLINAVMSFLKHRPDIPVSAGSRSIKIARYWELIPQLLQYLFVKIHKQALRNI
jgi:hypothetical protein